MAGIASLSLLGLWVVLAGSALAGRLKAQYPGTKLELGFEPGQSNRTRRRVDIGRLSPLCRNCGEGVAESDANAAITLGDECTSAVRACHCRRVSSQLHPVTRIRFRMCFLCAWLTRSLDLRGCFTTIWVLKEPGFSCCSFLLHRFRTVLLAKNLLHSILFVLVGFAAGILSCLRLGVPPFVVLSATGAWLVFALPCNLAAGNIFSLTIPYRIHPGRITRPAGAQANTLPAMLIQLGMLGVGALVFWLCWSLKITVGCPCPFFGIGRGRILCLDACIALLG